MKKGKETIEILGIIIKNYGMHNNEKYKPTTKNVDL